MTNFLTWWALPALCVLFVNLQMCRHIERRVPSELGSYDWATFMVGSTLWPFGVIAILYTLTSPFFKFLTKERRWLK